MIENGKEDIGNEEGDSYGSPTAEPVTESTSTARSRSTTKSPGVEYKFFFS